MSKCVCVWERERESARARRCVHTHADNDFEVFLDPSGSNHNYYELEVNALNTVWQLRLDKPYKNGGSEHSERVGMLGQGSLPNLGTAVCVDGSLNDPSVTDTGWGVVIRLPFKDLQAAGHCQQPPSAHDVWRINFSRVQWEWESRRDSGAAQAAWIKVPRPDHGNEGEDNWVWSPQGVINMHCPEKWGFLQFCPQTDGASHGGCPSGAEEEEWQARQVLTGWHYLLQDYRAAHEQRLPSDLRLLQLPEAEALAASQYGLDARPDQPGGYLAYVFVPSEASRGGQGRRRLCVNGDAELFFTND